MPISERKAYRAGRQASETRAVMLRLEYLARCRQRAARLGRAQYGDLHGPPAADHIRLPGCECADLVRFDLELVLEACGALPGGALLGVVARVLHRLACSGERDDGLGGVDAVADDRLDRAEDSLCLGVVSHPGDNLGREHEARV